MMKPGFAFILLALCISYVIAMPIRTVPDVNSDRQILEKLFNATNGLAWGNRRGWMTEEDHCTWTGIGCEEGRVTRIDLTENRMSGSLPAELAGLDKLVRLNLQYNKITGTIPAELAQLASLEILYLTGNRLNGTLPEAMGTFPSMREMFISGNWIHGQIPAVLANLKNLRSLHLEDAHFTGTIPAELAQLDQLQTLDIRGNKLLGTIPKNLLDQPSLRSVYILQAPGYDFYCTDLEIFKAKSLRTDVKETSPCAVYDPAAKESVIVTVITVSGGDDPTWFAASTSAQHRYRLGMSILFGVDEMKVVLDTVSVDDDGAIVITSLVTVPAQVDAPTTASAFKVANYFDVSNALSQNVLDIDAFPKQA